MPYGLLYFFDSGTNDDKATFADVNEEFPNPQPLILNGDGTVPNCFYSGSAKVILVTNVGTPTAPIDGTQQWERDPVTSAAIGAIGREWDAISIYDKNSVVILDDIFYVSIINANQNNNPSSTPTAWSQWDLLVRFNINETYQLADPVIASDGFLYTSLVIDNTGNDPTSTTGFWTLPAVFAASGAVVSNVAAQTLTTAVNTILAFDTESYDDDSFHDNSIDNSRLTVPSGVTRVRVSAMIEFASNSTGDRSIDILTNGAIASFGAGRVRVAAASTGETRITATTAPLNVTVADYFEARVRQDSGGNLDVSGGGTSTWFMIEVLK